jgi:hypothetical protein
MPRKVSGMMKKRKLSPNATWAARIESVTVVRSERAMKKTVVKSAIGGVIAGDRSNMAVG